MNPLQFRHTHKIHKRLPVSFDTISANGAEFEWPESRRPKQLHRIENSKNGLRILQRQIAVLYAKHHVEGFVRGRDLDFFGRRESLRHLGFQEKVEASILRKLLGIAQMDHRRDVGGAGLNVLTK